VSLPKLLRRYFKCITVSSSHRTHSSLPARELFIRVSGQISAKVAESLHSYQKKQTSKQLAIFLGLKVFKTLR